LRSRAGCSLQSVVNHSAPSYLQRERISPGERFGVPVICEHFFGQDYAKTLAGWRNSFRAPWPNLMPLGFDDRFRRLWEYYLAYCEAGFLSGNIDVRQVVFAKSK
jgi:cyclopropane-fatty-acyl-phospholipid synthase